MNTKQIQFLKQKSRHILVMYNQKSYAICPSNMDYTRSLVWCLFGGGLYYVLKPDFETWVKPMVTSPFNPNFF